MGEIIALPLRARDANAASRFELIGGELHHATMLTFPRTQLRDIRNVWGMTVEGPPRVASDAVPFSDGQPRRAKMRAKARAKSSVAKAADANTSDAKPTAKRKPVQSSPE